MYSETSKFGESRKKNNTHSSAKYVNFLSDASFCLGKYGLKPLLTSILPPPFPFSEPPQLSVSVVRQHNSPLLLAVCDCKGEGVGTNLTWALPENALGETSLHTENKGHIMNVKLTYQFRLDLHEGQDLTCLYQSDNGITEKRTVHIPRYCECNWRSWEHIFKCFSTKNAWCSCNVSADISSVKVLNNTSTLQNRNVDQSVVYRVSVDENQRNQKVLLKVEGNVPEYNLDCRRWCFPLLRCFLIFLYKEVRLSIYYYRIQIFVYLPFASKLL